MSDTSKQGSTKTETVMEGSTMLKMLEKFPRWTVALGGFLAALAVLLVLYAGAVVATVEEDGSGRVGGPFGAGVVYCLPFAACGE